MTATVEVLGERVALPVEIRSASLVFATFPVDRAAAQALLDPTGLRAAARLPGGRALASLAAVAYADGDLGPYHEVALALVVEHPRGVSGTGPVGAYIHQLPVNAEFTRAAGREIWGFPKYLADIDLRLADRCPSVRLAVDGEPVVAVELAPAVPVPTRATALDAYSFRDGELRRTAWTIAGGGLRVRPGGARVHVHGEHPFARDLRALGFPRRALLSGRLARVRMTFEAPEAVRP